MTQQMSVKFDFLESYVQHLLDENGFLDLPQQARNQFLPQIRSEIDRRLGIAVLPLLTEQAALELKELLEKEDFTQEDLEKFWTKNVPNFKEVVEATLRSFADEFSNVLSKIRAK